MYAIGLRRGVAGIALALTGFIGLAPVAPADPPVLLVPVNRVETTKTKVYAPPPYILELPSEVTLTR